MTMTDRPTRTTTPELVTLDIYRDVHKGIRGELFTLTLTAGRIDPGDETARATLAADVCRVVDFLVSHAQHEDRAVEPVLEVHLPEYASRIAQEHLTLEARMDDLRTRADEAVWARGSAPAVLTHTLYRELASFTGAYLEHQDYEERVVMPALQDAVGVPGVGAIHAEILSGIPPAEMAESLAIMLPAMNIDGRAQLLGGMREDAPTPVFEGMWGLAGSVLDSSDYAALGARLGIA